MLILRQERSHLTLLAARLSGELFAVFRGLGLLKGTLLSVETFGGGGLVTFQAMLRKTVGSFNVALRTNLVPFCFSSSSA